MDVLMKGRENPSQNHIKEETGEKWGSEHSVKIITSLPGASCQAHEMLPLRQGKHQGCGI